LWEDERSKELYLAAKDRTISHEARLSSVRELGTLSCGGCRDAIWALGELVRHQETTYEVKREAKAELARAETAQRSGRRR
jgi:hypothetical protein